MRNAAKLSRPARIFAVLAACLMGWTAAAFSVSLLAMRATSSRMLHESIALAPESLQAQKELIEERVGELAEKYHFSPSLVLDRIDEETLKDLNRQVIAWWTEMASTGFAEPIPMWEGEGLPEALQQDPDFTRDLNTAQVRKLSNQVASAVKDAIQRASFPLRDEIFTQGVKKARSYADVPGIVHALRRLPTVFGLLALFFAGLVWLLCAANLREAVKYSGAAAGCAGLLVLLCLILLRVMDFPGMIVESSARLAAQATRLTDRLTLEGAGIAVLWLAASFLCLWLSRREKS